MKTTHALAALCAIGFLTPAAARPSPAADCAALDAVHDGYVAAYRSGDAAATAAFYAEDAVYVGTGGDLTRGREKILEGLRREMPVFKDFSARSEESGCSGDLGWERGAFSARLETPNQPVRPLAGRYLIVYRRGADGSWKIRDQFTSKDRDAGR